MSDPLKPSGTLLIKLGSLIIHHEEAASPTGHPLDQHAIAGLRNDPEVVEWIDTMNGLAMLPVKR